MSKATRFNGILSSKNSVFRRAFKHFLSLGKVINFYNFETV